MRAWCDALAPHVEQAVAELEPVDEIKAAIAAKRYCDDYELKAAE